MALHYNMALPVSNSSLCHTICFLIVNSSTGLVECFTGVPRPKGVLPVPNYKESTIATWSQEQRRSQGFLPPQLRAGRRSHNRDPQLLPLHSAPSLWALPGIESSPEVFPNCTNLPAQLKETNLAYASRRYLWPDG